MAILAFVGAGGGGGGGGEKAFEGKRKTSSILLSTTLATNIDRDGHNYNTVQC